MTAFWVTSVQLSSVVVTAGEIRGPAPHVYHRDILMPPNASEIQVRVTISRDGL